MKVIVTTNEKNEVIVPSENNNEYGYVRVEQTRGIFDENGFFKHITLSALVPGKIDDLEILNWTKDKQLSGRIIVRESLIPFNKKNPEKDLKIAGDTGVVCKKDGQAIYRTTVYRPDPNAQDETIKHTNGDEIREAYEQLQDIPQGNHPTGKVESFNLED